MSRPVAELEDELERRTLCEVCMAMVNPKDHISCPCRSYGVGLHCVQSEPHWRIRYLLPYLL